MEERLSIRAVSERYRVSARTLRFYEEAGVLNSRRKEGSRYREYDSGQLRRLEVVLLLRRLAFSVQEIAALLCGDISRFREVLEKRIVQSDRALMEAKETNALLRRFSLELNAKAPRDISAESVLGEFVYLTKQSERRIPMPAFEASPHRVAISTNIAFGLTNENEGDLIGKVKGLRAEFAASGGAPLPIIRLYDTEDIPFSTVIIYWDGKEEVRLDCSERDLKSCGDEIIERLKALHLKQAGKR